MIFFENCLFLKMSLFKNCVSVKINAMLHNFVCDSRRILAWSCNWRGKGVGALEVHINLMPPGVTKISFFSIFWTFRAASS